MLKNKNFNIIAISAMIIAIIITSLLYDANKYGIKNSSSNPKYMYKLFDDRYVHEINIEIDNFDDFINNALDEEYIKCNIKIDDDTINQVAIRVKGNNSKRLTSEYGLVRYSFKIEFDHYDNNLKYYGLDKLSLDASFQDNTYLKTWLAFDMMSYMDVPSPLTSFVWLKINGYDWGLYLAIEEMEESFLRRNYGNDYGNLYKPEYKSLKAKNDDIALKYIDDNISSYPAIFNHNKTKVNDNDKQRLINSIKALSLNKDLDKYINIDEVIRYFVVSNFVMNWDSYIGYTGHNYLLYEKDGVIEMLPWDYNLAFGTYALGMTNAIKDSDIIINYPINTPCTKEVMLNRPLYHNLMVHNEYLDLYHKYFNILTKEYFDSGLFNKRIYETHELIKDFIKQDPTTFVTYEDHLLAYKTLIEICNLRNESIKGQLSNKYPIKLSQITKDSPKVNTKHINLKDLGDFDDLRNSKKRQQEALNRIK